MRDYTISQETRKQKTIQDVNWVFYFGILHCFKKDKGIFLEGNLQASMAGYFYLYFKDYWKYCWINQLHYQVLTNENNLKCSGEKIKIRLQKHSFECSFGCSFKWTKGYPFYSCEYLKSIFRWLLKIEDKNEYAALKLMS